MPSWRIHLITGMIVTILLLYVCYTFGLRELFFQDNEIEYFFWFHVCFISILGSLLPDFDSRKTRIRHTLGPVLGMFLIVSYIYLHRFSHHKINPEFVIVVLFLLIIIVFILGIVIPFKHHGRMHSITAAGLFVISWMAIELLVFEASLLQTAVIGLFGFLGYFSHLALDLDLKWL